MGVIDLIRFVHLFVMESIHRFFNLHSELFFAEGYDLFVLDTLEMDDTLQVGGLVALTDFGLLLCRAHQEIAPRLSLVLLQHFLMRSHACRVLQLECVAISSSCCLSVLSQSILELKFFDRLDLLILIVSFLFQDVLGSILAKVCPFAHVFRGKSLERVLFLKTVFGYKCAQIVINDLTGLL